MISRAALRCSCQGTTNSNAAGAMISRDASIINAARLVVDTFPVESLRELRMDGKTSRTQMAMRLVGSGCFSRRAR